MSLNNYGYSGKGVIAESLHVNNVFHRDMAAKGSYGGYLVTSNERPRCFRSVDLSEIRGKQGALDQEVALASGAELRSQGLSLPPGVAENYKPQSIDSYMLSSAFCYVEVRTRDGVERFFATKNAAVLLTLRSRMAPADRKKHLDSFKEQYSNSYTELEGGQFKVVKVLHDVDGFRLSKHRISTSGGKAVIIPVYAVSNYADTIANFLHRQRGIVVYSVEGVDRTVYTSIHPSITSRWLGTTEQDAAVQMHDIWMNPLSFGQITFPDLANEGQFLSVPLFSIKSIEPFGYPFYR